MGVKKWGRGEGSGVHIVREHVMSTVFIKLSTMHNEELHPSPPKLYIWGHPCKMCKINIGLFSHGRWVNICFLVLILKLI